MTIEDFPGPQERQRRSDASAAERREEEAARWMLRGREGLDAAEQAAFQAWLAADPRNQQEYRALEQLWDGLDRAPRAAVERLRQQPGPVQILASPGAQATGRKSTGRSPRRWRGMAAAAAALVLSVSWIGSQWQPGVQHSVQYTTGRGEQRSVTLPDGSRLDLDADTQVKIMFYPDRRRAVLERGRSMFEVSRNPQRPFEVVAADVSVQVLGTRFSVGRSRSPVSREERVAVAVEEGHVRVQSSAARTLVDMLPGRGRTTTADLTGGQGIGVAERGEIGQVRKVSPGTVAPWRSGRAMFDDMPLAEVLAEFERYGDTGLVIQDPRVAQLRVTGNFDLRPARGFARALPVALPVRLVPHGDGRQEIVLD